MPLAPIDSELRIDVARRTVHGLHEEILEVEFRVIGERLIVLRHDDLQLVALRHDQRRAGFRAHANPVDAVQHRQRTIRFDRHFEAGGMQGIDERRVDLQHGLTACADHELVRFAFRPLRRDHGDEVCRRAIFAAVLAIRADEIRVAKLADCVRAIFLATRPEIAAGEAAEHSRTAGVCAFALQRVENFLYCIRHDQTGSVVTCSPDL
jgi:hypothetical protein